MSPQPSILYVEDDAMSRTVMEIVLIHQMSLTHVAIFEDSSRFAERLTELSFQPDIVFLDIHMDPIDGFEMLKILRALPQYAARPIVALTASVMNEEVMKLREAGFNGIIPKPIDIDAFPEMVTKLVAGQEIWRVIRAH
jgi:CheY-like chemotaxis protein